MNEQDIQQTSIDAFKSLLHEFVCVVEFTKVDGSYREMRCTLNNDMIPEEYTPKGKKNFSTNEVIRAYDINAEGFRSFKVNNIITFNVRPNETKLESSL